MYVNYLLINLKMIETGRGKQITRKRYNAIYQKIISMKSFSFMHTLFFGEQQN